MRYGMVIDLRRCVGCNACTTACKQEKGTPKGIFWSQVLITETGHYPKSRIEFLPILCNHCAKAPCVEVCPEDALIKHPNGIVAVDQDKCIGCRSCELACPYDAGVIVLDVDPYYNEKGFSPIEKVALSRHPLGVAGKCDFCESRLMKGKKPACVKACTAKARIFGDLEDPNSEVSKLLNQAGCRQLLQDLGTDPSVCYLEAPAMDGAKVMISTSNSKVNQS